MNKRYKRTQKHSAREERQKCCSIFFIHANLHINNLCLAFPATFLSSLSLFCSASFVSAPKYSIHRSFTYLFIQTDHLNAEPSATASRDGRAIRAFGPITARPHILIVLFAHCVTSRAMHPGHAMKDEFQIQFNSFRFPPIDGFPLGR